MNMQCPRKKLESTSLHRHLLFYNSQDYVLYQHYKQSLYHQFLYQTKIQHDIKQHHNYQNRDIQKKMLCLLM